MQKLNHLQKEGLWDLGQAIWGYMLEDSLIDDMAFTNLIEMLNQYRIIVPAEIFSKIKNHIDKEIAPYFTSDKILELDHNLRSAINASGKQFTPAEKRVIFLYKYENYILEDWDIDESFDPVIKFIEKSSDPRFTTGDPEPTLKRLLKVNANNTKRWANLFGKQIAPHLKHIDGDPIETIHQQHIWQAYTIIDDYMCFNNDLSDEFDEIKEELQENMQYQLFLQYPLLPTKLMQQIELFINNIRKTNNKTVVSEMFTELCDKHIFPLLQQNTEPKIKPPLRLMTDAKGRKNNG